MTEPTQRLECRRVTKRFCLRGREIAPLTSIDLTVAPGESIVIHGRSGSGKSTLLGILAGLDQPTSGQVLFEGAALEALSEAKRTALRRGRIGLVFQTFNLIASWTALENVEAALAHDGLSRRARREKAAETLAAFGLGERLDNLPTELSVGETQRVALARTLVTKPTLLLADEPTGGVDPETGSEILSRLLGHVRETNASLVAVTHNSAELIPGARRLRLESGSLRPVSA